MKQKETTFIWLWWEISDVIHVSDYNTAGNASKEHKQEENWVLFYHKQPGFGINDS